MERKHYSRTTPKKKTQTMVLYVEAKDWLEKNGLVGFIQVARARAPPHKEQAKVTKTINIDDISEATMHATIEL